MVKFCFIILDKKIFFYTDSKKCIEKMNEKKSILKTMPCEIVCLGETSSVLETENVICFLNTDEKNIRLDKEENMAFLFGKEEELFFPDIIYLAMGMFANVFQNEGKYFLQASAIKYNDSDSVLFLGDPGSGKTTIAYLIFRELGGKLISNDNVLVGMDVDGDFSTFVGSKSVQMRLGAIKLLLPELLEGINIPKSDKNDMDIKLNMDKKLKNMGLEYADNSKVKNICLINTLKDSDAMLFQKELVDSRLKIYEHLTKQIRSNRYVITSFDYPLPSFEKDEFLQKRYDLTKKIVDDVNIIEGRGDVHQLVKKLSGSLR